MNESKVDIFTPLKKHSYYGKQDYEVLTWEEIINNFNKNILLNQTINLLPGYTLITADIYENKKVISILEELSIQNPKHICTAHLYVSFSE